MSAIPSPPPSEAPEIGSGVSGDGADHAVDVYITLHHTGNPNEDILINSAMLDSIYGFSQSFIISSIFWYIISSVGLAIGDPEREFVYHCLTYTHYESLIY
jgi:hypothetical protein